MNERIENQVNRLRKEAKVTQEDLATAVGVTRQTVIAMERGNYTPSVALAMRIAKYFNKQVEDIFYLDK